MRSADVAIGNLRWNAHPCTGRPALTFRVPATEPG